MLRKTLSLRVAVVLPQTLFAPQRVPRPQYYFCERRFDCHVMRLRMVINSSTATFCDSVSLVPHWMTPADCIFLESWTIFRQYHFPSYGDSLSMAGYHIESASS